mgnify:CR=1 FL=1
MFRPSVKNLLGSYRFALDLLCRLLTSAFASRHLSMSVAQWRSCRSPRVLRTHLHAYACRIYVVAFRTSMGFDDIGHLTPLRRLISASCSSGQRFAFGFLQISSHPEHPCRSANSSPCRASRGLSPPSKCALPGAPNKRHAQACLFSFGDSWGKLRHSAGLA